MDEASLEIAVNIQYSEHKNMIDSEDYIEGPKAFAEKRPPAWKNR
jgi:crotonobetainyl-CoA hydratase